MNTRILGGRDGHRPGDCAVRLGQMRTPFFRPRRAPVLYPNPRFRPGAVARGTPAQ